ncbi:MAG: FadR family transcriptional regulator [Firmicutes bacterium]|nr:FadR family transcriptional regulator [Bacillota bacterium]MCL5039625.1 FadR family transcriptional regulator [Bacillota bacterium]
MALKRLSRQGGLAEAVRREIEQLMIDGSLKPGSKLPPERDLATQLGVGMSTLREALRALEEQGAIEIVHGRGTFVRGVSHKAIKANLQFMVNFENNAYDDLLELRLLLETGLVKLAAMRRDPDDLKTLETFLKEMAEAKSNEEIVEAGARFHLAIAKASKNSIAATVYEAVTQVISEVFRAHTKSPAQHNQSLNDHAAIYRAIADRNPDLAVQSALRHLEHLKRNYFEEAEPNKGAE